MKCLVTGGAGFIGSHLCEQLLKLGYEVGCVDNLITGNKENISHLLSNPNFQFTNHDVTRELPRDLKADIIFHFASPASPPKYIKYARETFLVNTYGSFLLLEKAVSWHARFIYASTSEVYGDPQVHPQPESYWGYVNSAGERSCYDESKRAGEALIMSYVRNKSIDAKIIRIFNTYGPKMDLNDGRVITNFLREIKNSQPLSVYGDGKQTRSFCYITDLVDGIIKVMNSSKLDGEIINLGNPEEISILDLAKLMMNLTEYKGQIKFQDLPPDDPVRRQPDISKAKTVISWQPLIDLATGLKKTIAYYLK